MKRITVLMLNGTTRVFATSNNNYGLFMQDSNSSSYTQLCGDDFVAGDSPRKFLSQIRNSFLWEIEDCGLPMKIIDSKFWDTYIPKTEKFRSNNQLVRRM